MFKFMMYLHVFRIVTGGAVRIAVHSCDAQLAVVTSLSVYSWNGDFMYEFIQAARYVYHLRGYLCDLSIANFQVSVKLSHILHLSKGKEIRQARDFVLAAFRYYRIPAPRAEAVFRSL